MNKYEVDFNSLEKIEDDTFLKIQGKFVDVIVSQSGSRGLQKSLKLTSPHILSKILDEVRKIK